MTRVRSSMVLLGICVAALLIGALRLATERTPLPAGSSYSAQPDGALALYTPPAHAAVSLEPRSALPDALALAADDPTLATGLRAVAPGAPWHAWARLALATHRPLAP